MVECTTLDGSKKIVEKDQLSFRPAAYSVIINNGKILLIRTSLTNKYSFPGGGIELGDKVELSLEREIMEEVGIEVIIDKFLFFNEDFFYFEPWDKAFHSFFFFYLCTAKSLDISKPHQSIDFEETETPLWVDFESLKPEDFQASGVENFILLKKYLEALSE